MHRTPFLSVLLVSLGLGPLLRAETPDFAFLGVMTKSIRDGDPKSGLRVTYVFPHSAAEEMGLRAGDEIFTLNDIIIEELDQLTEELRREKIDATIRFRVRREGEESPIALAGKIGSYKKTIKLFEDDLRERFVGKPLPKLPPIRWWDATKNDWSESTEFEKLIEGKVAIVFGCNGFTQVTRRPDKSAFVPNWPKFRTAATALRRALPGGPFVFVGLFHDERLRTKEGEEAMLRSAAELFRTDVPPFPVGVALFPEDMEAEDREGSFFIRNRGVAMLDKEGKLRYLTVLDDYVQVRDDPGTEFLGTLQKLLAEAGAPLPLGGSPRRPPESGGATANDPAEEPKDAGDPKGDS